MTKTPLKTDWNFGTDGDDVYAALIRAHDGLSDAESQRLNARLVLLLANHIGDSAILYDALEHARTGLNSGKS